jgi:hypothetical protein
VHLTDSKGYVFSVTVDEEPEVPLAAGEVAVGVLLASPRSAFLLPPRAVERYEVMALIIHLGAMLDGLVEAVDPDGDEGWVGFPSLLLSVRRIYAPDGLVGFEVSTHDCGCEDQREFNHGGFITLMLEPGTLEHEVTVLDAALRSAGRVSGGPTA